MNKRDALPVAHELETILRRVVSDRRAETLYDTQGAPVAILLPVTEAGTATARDLFLQLLRELREGNADEQRRQWEELEAVLAEERSLGSAA
jgi:hypothetical protein